MTTSCLNYTGSHNIHEGDIKRILGLIGTLIQKYQIRMGGKYKDEYFHLINNYVCSYTRHSGSKCSYHVATSY